MSTTTLPTATATATATGRVVVGVGASVLDTAPHATCALVVVHETHRS